MTPLSFGQFKANFANFLIMDAVCWFVKRPSFKTVMGQFPESKDVVFGGFLVMCVFSQFFLKKSSPHIITYILKKWQK